jgi:hypothetical protein
MVKKHLVMITLAVLVTGLLFWFVFGPHGPELRSC